MKTIPQYHILNRTRIRTVPQQVLHRWSNNYNGYGEHAMRRLYNRFPQETIQRDNLISKNKDPIYHLFTINSCMNYDVPLKCAITIKLTNYM